MKRLLFILCGFIIPVSVYVGQTGGLVAHYMCDGNGRDTSGNGNHGTINGPVAVADRFGKSSSALFFDGQNDFISVPNSSSLNPSQITVMAWYKTEDFEGNGFSPFLNKSFSSHTDPYYQYKLGVSGSLYSFNAGRFIFALSINGTMYMLDTPAQSYLVGKWYHVCGTYDGTVMKLFVDGILVSSIAVSGSITTYNTNMMLGNNPTANDFLKGTLDDIRIYNRSLNEEELTNLTSIKEQTTNPSEVVIFPNPASHKIDIVCDQLMNAGNFEIYNTGGQSLKKGDWSEPVNSLELSVIDLPEGIYFLILSDKGSRHQKKFVIQR